MPTHARLTTHTNSFTHNWYTEHWCTSSHSHLTLISWPRLQSYKNKILLDSPDYDSYIFFEDFHWAFPSKLGHPTQHYAQGTVCSNFDNFLIWCLHQRPDITAAVTLTFLLFSLMTVRINFCSILIFPTNGQPGTIFPTVPTTNFFWAGMLPPHLFATSLNIIKKKILLMLFCYYISYKILADFFYLIDD